MKKLLIIFFAFSASFFGLVTISHAAFFPTRAAQQLTKTQDKVEKRASNAAEKQNLQLSNIIKRGDQMITLRLTSLNTLLTRLQNAKNVTDSDKTTLTADINATIANLTSLKSKIDGDTDTTTAKADVKSIVTTYHIYIMYLPKVNLLLALDKLTTAQSSVSSLSGQVQTFITNQKNAGKDVTILQSLQDDITNKLADISSKIAADRTLLAGVNASTTNPSSVFSQVRKDLAAIRQDFNKIRSDFAQMRSNLKSLKVTPTPTLASTPTPTP